MPDSQYDTAARAPLYSASECRALDRVAIEQHGIPGIVLMKRAGRAAFDVLCRRYPGLSRITVLCGAGNNGGDGYVIAALARQRGIEVGILRLTPTERLRGDARRACDWALAQGVAVQDFAASLLPDHGVLVDALLGTGLSGPPRPQYAEAIAAINASSLPVLAVDIPSGLCADSGSELGQAVRATDTVTFIGRKRGLYTAAGPACCGRIHFAALDLPDSVLQQVEASVLLLPPVPEPVLAPRARNAHKGHFGHLLVLGGDRGKGGAALMAAEAAARCGAGLVSVATRPEHIGAGLARCPELMIHGVAARSDLSGLLDRASVLAVGPGLGTSAWGEELLQAALQSRLPVVIDADGLNLLVQRSALRALLHGQQILTPHPGEAARMLQTDSAAVQQDRFGAVLELQRRFGGTVVLKGAGSLVCNGATTALCPFGNPGMGSGGMGDVLTGVIAALLAQGFALPAAAEHGVVLHACAADAAAARDGERGLLATDLLAPLRRLLNPSSGRAR